MATTTEGPSNASDSEVVNKEWKLPKDHELRIEVEGNEKVIFLILVFNLLQNVELVN